MNQAVLLSKTNSRESYIHIFFFSKCFEYKCINDKNVYVRKHALGFFDPYFKHFQKNESVSLALLHLLVWQFRRKYTSIHRRNPRVFIGYTAFNQVKSSVTDGKPLGSNDDINNEYAQNMYYSFVGKTCENVTFHV